MPYIKQGDRPNCDYIIRNMKVRNIKANGDLNYILFSDALAEFVRLIASGELPKDSKFIIGNAEIDGRILPVNAALLPGNEIRVLP